MIEDLVPIASGLLRTHRCLSIVFWVADGEDGWASTYGCFARPTGDGRAKMTLRLLGAGGLDTLTGTS
jgi:hypothetical protein